MIFCNSVKNYHVHLSFTADQFGWSRSRKWAMPLCFPQL